MWCFLMLYNDPLRKHDKLFGTPCMIMVGIRYSWYELNFYEKLQWKMQLGYPTLVYQHSVLFFITYCDGYKKDNNRFVTVGCHMDE